MATTKKDRDWPALLEGAGLAVALAAVAGIAGIVSYTHIYDLALTHSGGPGHQLAARLVPFSIDGTIVAASITMLIGARRKLDTPPLARWMLYGGIAATVAANVTYGVAWGWVGGVGWALPALAFCGGVELLAQLWRGPQSAADPLLAAVRTRYADELARGAAPAIRRIRADFSVGQARAKRLRGQLAG